MYLTQIERHPDNEARRTTSVNSRWTFWRAALCHWWLFTGVSLRDCPGGCVLRKGRARIAVMARALATRGNAGFTRAVLKLA